MWGGVVHQPLSVDALPTRLADVTSSLLNATNLPSVHIFIIYHLAQTYRSSWASACTVPFTIDAAPSTSPYNPKRHVIDHLRAPDGANMRLVAIEDEVCNEAITLLEQHLKEHDIDHGLNLDANKIPRVQNEYGIVHRMGCR